MINKIMHYFKSTYFLHFSSCACFVLIIILSSISLSLDSVSPFNYINIAIAGLFLVLSIIVLLFNKGISKKIFSDLFVICIVGLLITFVLSWLANLSSGLPKTPILVSLLALALYLWFRFDKKYIDFYLLAFLISTWIFIVIFVVCEYQAILHPSFSQKLSFNTLGNANDVARHICFCIIMNIVSAVYFKSNKIKIIAIVALVPLVYLLLITLSISNIIIFVISIFILGVILSGKRNRPYFIIGSLIVIGCLVCCIIFIPALSSIKERFIAIFAAVFKKNNMGVKPDGSVSDRISAAMGALEMFANSPLFGNGYNSVSSSFSVMAHNNFAEIAANHGIFALMFEETILLYPIFDSDKIIGKKNKTFFLFIIYMILLQFVLVSFNQKVELILLSLLYATFKNNNEEFGYLPIFDFNKKNDEIECCNNHSSVDVSNIKVSVVCPLHNNASTVEETIDSILNQTHQNFEIIIINDNSTDDSLLHVKKITDSRIKIINNKENCGAAYSRNIGIKSATGDFIAFLDCDDVWRSTKLEKQLKFMVENNHKFCATYYSIIDENSKETGDYVIGPKKASYKNFLRNNYVGCLTIMVKKELLSDIEVPNIIRRRNDYALWILISKKEPCYFLKEDLAKYRKNYSKQSLSSTSRSLLYKSTIEMYQCVLGVSKLRANIMGIRFLFYFFAKKFLYSKKKTSIMNKDEVEVRNENR